MLRRRGRGRLSSIDLLPEEAQDDVRWAIDELNANRRSQEEILSSFNLRLAVKGIGPISRSAFNRKSLRQAEETRDLILMREAANGWGEKFEDGIDETVTMLISETIKAATYFMLRSGGRLPFTSKNAESVMFLARALKDVTSSEKVTADLKQLSDKQFVRKADAAIDKVAAVKGLSADAKKALRAELFGLVDVKN
jgi:hypothetical protein